MHRTAIPGPTMVLARCCLAAGTAALAAQEPPAPAPATAGTIEMPGIRKLTIGGQYRLRYENQIRFDFDDAGNADNDFFTQRLRVDLGLELTDDLSALVQFQDAREWGEEVGTLDDDADGLDVHQGWLDIASTPGIGGALRLGRQELAYGDQRLIGNLDWRTQARSFDGARGRWSLGDKQPFDVFAVQLRENLDAVADDGWFLGGYATLRPGDDIVADLYLLWLHDDGVASGGSANRGTLGTRWVVGSRPFEAGLELATQFGDEAGIDVPILDTWAAHAHVLWRGDGDCRPYGKLGLDLASGDDPDTADGERFANLFPTAHAHWGMMDLALWENLIDPHVQVGFVPGESWDCSIAWHYFRSMEATDRFGGPNGTISAGGAGFSNTMGNEVDLIVTRALELPKGLKGAVQAGYGIFLPGAGAQDARGTDDVAHFVYGQLQVSF